MTKPLTISITGNNVAEVKAALLELAAALGAENVQSVALASNAPAATVEVGPTPTPAADPAPTPAPAEDNTANDAPAEPEGVVKDMTPAEARETGIKEVQAHFSAHPDSITTITEIQKKYGVKMFTEITDAKAFDFLADVRLLTAGAPTAGAS